MPADGSEDEGDSPSTSNNGGGDAEGESPNASEAEDDGEEEEEEEGAVVSCTGTLFPLLGPCHGRSITVECISVAEPRSIYSVEMVVVEGIALPPTSQVHYDKTALVLPAPEAEGVPPVADLLEWAAAAVGAGVEAILWALPADTIQAVIDEIEEDHTHIFLPIPIILLPDFEARLLLQVTWLDLTFDTDPKTHRAAAMRRALFQPLEERDPAVQDEMVGLCKSLGACFRDLTRDDWHQLVGSAQHRFVPPQQFVCVQGEVETCGYVITGGHVSLEYHDGGPDGVVFERMSRDLTNGKHFGEVAMHGARARAFSAEATTDGVDLLVFSHAHFAKHLHDHRLDNMVAVLEKPPEERRIAEVRKLLELVDELAPGGAETTPHAGNGLRRRGAMVDFGSRGGREAMGFLQGFTEDERLAFARRLKVHKLAKGQTICRKGEEADCMFLILSGTVAYDKGTSKRNLRLSSSKNSTPVTRFVRASILEAPAAPHGVTSQISLSRSPREDRLRRGSVGKNSRRGSMSSISASEFGVSSEGSTIGEGFFPEDSSEGGSDGAYALGSPLGAGSPGGGRLRGRSPMLSPPTTPHVSMEVTPPASQGDTRGGGY